VCACVKVGHESAVQTRKTVDAGKGGELNSKGVLLGEGP
jgi:hypothetical protein